MRAVWIVRFPVPELIHRLPWILRNLDSLCMCTERMGVCVWGGGGDLQVAGNVLSREAFDVHEVEDSLRNRLCTHGPVQHRSEEIRAQYFVTYPLVMHQIRDADIPDRSGAAQGLLHDVIEV